MNQAFAEFDTVSERAHFCLGCETHFFGPGIEVEGHFFCDNACRSKRLYNVTPSHERKQLLTLVAGIHLLSECDPPASLEVMECESVRVGKKWISFEELKEAALAFRDLLCEGEVAWTLAPMEASDELRGKLAGGAR